MASTALALLTAPRFARLVVLTLVLGVLLAAAALPGVAIAQSRLATTQSAVEALRGREQALRANVATFSRLIDRLSSDVAILQSRQAALESALAREQAELGRVQAELQRARTRLAALRARLAFSRRVLARRLVAIYKSDGPDVMSVVVTSRGWVDLLERAEFMQRINQQDQRVIHTVRLARDSVAALTRRLGALEARQRRTTLMVRARRNQVATLRYMLDRKRAGLQRARADVAVALRAVRTRRGRLESRLAALQAAQARLGAHAGALGALAGWAIPWNIVRCESGGRNWPPNSAGASGYYQIIPSTWKAFGGRGPAAYLAPKAEQDRVAARIYRNGAGAGNWVCAGM